VHDILAYNDAIDVVKQYVDRNPGTVMISVSDHETGGFSLGYQHGDAYPIYDWYPQYLLNVRHSGEYIAQKILEVPLLMRASFVRDTVLNNWLDIKEPDQENIDYLSSPLRKKTELEYYCGKIISELAGLGWSTHGHSAVDVNLYAYGSHSSELVGNHENTDIGDFIRRNLNLKRRMDDITERLNK
jgi:alkaline phosphatase